MTQARILVVEDESIVALHIKSTLESAGYTVPALASSGEEAIQRAADTHPDLVLMDIKLRGPMDGIQAAEQIRTRFNIPVIYLTAFADEATLQRAKITEPFGYLLKPFEEPELQISIEMALHKHQMERRLQESKRWLATTLRSIGDAVIATDAAGRIKFMNPMAEALTGWSQSEALGEHLSQVFDIVSEQGDSSTRDPVSKAIQEGVTVHLAHHLLITRNGKEVPIGDNAAPIRDEVGNIIGAVLVFRDISERVQAEKAREELITELQEALAQVKTLSGLLPICASCKKIRNDQGYWQQVEDYIREHSEAEFSHGLCPDCARKLYPELYNDEQ